MALSLFSASASFSSALGLTPSMNGMRATVSLDESKNTMGMEDVGIDMLMDAMDAAEAAAGGPTTDEIFKKPKEVFSVNTMPGISGPLGVAGLTAWDPAGFTTDASEGKIRFYREVELKHGRVAMLAAVGILIAEPFHPLWGGSIDVPAYIAFQETPLQAFWPAVVLAIAIPEIFSVFSFESPFGGEPWTIRRDHVAGDLGFDPLGLKPEDPLELAAMQTKELNNGRLAMIAVAGMIGQELATGNKLF